MHPSCREIKGLKHRYLYRERVSTLGSEHLYHLYMAYMALIGHNGINL